MKRLILGVSQPPTVTETLRGRSLVVGLYALIVAFAGTAGALFGAFGPEDMTTVKLLGVVELQPTALNLAVYGMVTIGLGLGVLLGLVVYVSRNLDSEEVGNRENS
ncbi:DUF7520 family protein [Halorussus halophilus]|uniref:DUF7520 family protein n=1 Tax=Halorussus halophilus TaxID=2650975 RepID=UPI0017877ECB|nr:cox cluster protein [Halorussus halophilus]